MKRDYETGESADVRYFVGVEVEKTPAHGMRTLFIVGFEHPDTIIDMAKKTTANTYFLVQIIPISHMLQTTGKTGSK